jgi:hypothetical protein
LNLEPRISPENRRVALLIALLATLGVGGPVDASHYTFVNIAEVSGPYNAFDTPALNDQGSVAFFAYLNGGGQAICRARAGSLEVIADTINDPFVSFTGVGGLQLQSRPDLDNAGRVAYRAYLFEPPWDYYSALFLDDGVTRVARTDWGSGAVHELDWCNATTNGAGQSAFTGRAAGVQGVHVATLGTYGVRIDETAGFSATFGSPFITPAGHISFSAVRLPSESGIFALIGGTLHTLARAGVDIYNYSAETSMNDAGRVVFRGEPEEFVQGILAATVDSVWTIADNNGPYWEFGEPAINNAGQVVFYASLRGYQRGIFTGPDPDQDVIIRSGDPLFGSTVNFFQFANTGLNEQGQVAFNYSLDDGRSGIALATPEPVGVAEDAATGGGGPRPTLRIWPNPTHGGARLELSPAGGPAPESAEIVDATGRLVRRLGPDDALPGSRGWSWDGRNAAGAPVPGGVYFVRLPGKGGRPAERIIVTR